MKFIILPGTPPSKYYYSLWINELKESFPGSSFHYFDNEALDIKKDAKTSLQIMQTRVHKKIKEAKDNESRTIIIGHSFGCYFLEAFLKNPQYEVILIFPFLGEPTSQGKRKLDFAFYLQPFYQFKFIQKAFHTVLKSFMPESRFITADEMIKGIKTAGIEQEVLRDSISWSTTTTSSLNSSASKSTLIYNSEDKWCTLKTVKFLEGLMQSISVNITHDFVLYKDQRGLMTSLLEKHLQ